MFFLFLFSSAFAADMLAAAEATSAEPAAVVEVDSVPVVLAEFLLAIIGLYILEYQKLPTSLFDAPPPVDVPAIIFSSCP
jgi:hypothetical protein